MKNPQQLGMKEYFRLEALKLRNLFKTKEFWKDLDKALAAYAALEIIWAKTEDAEHCDGILYKKIQSEFKTQYGGDYKELYRCALPK